MGFIRRYRAILKRLAVCFVVLGVFYLYFLHDLDRKIKHVESLYPSDIDFEELKPSDIKNDPKIYKPKPPSLLDQLSKKTPAFSTLSTSSKSPIKETQLKDNEFEEKDMIDENGNPYTIILWVNRSGKPGYVADPEVCLGNISCTITYDKSLLNVAHSVVFKGGGVSITDLPPQDSRKYYQQYAWWTAESPLHTSAEDSSKLTNYFNLTFHYRTDADVYAPYGSINLILRELKAAGETDLESLLEKKKNSGKMAAWAVSNCYGSRINYAKSLMGAGLQVDTYGGCFGGREIGKGRYSDSFYEALSRYKFYFSFENSITCKDYFTEKFWFNGLRSGAVPIVWGPRKEDILKVAPTKSFIHTSDFSSPQKLVEYLNYLASNETAYAEYLEWRTWVNHPERIEERLKMKNRDNDLRSFCKLCSILQADGRRRKLGQKSPQRIISSIYKAWNEPEKNQCHN